MFQELQPSGRKRWNLSLVFSFAVQLALLALLLYPLSPSFLTPVDTQLGIPGSSGSLSIVYIAPVGPEQAKPALETPRLTLHTAVPKKPRPPKPEPKPDELAAKTADAAADQTARGGSPFGHVPGSPLNTDEVVPAFPDVYPDPPVSSHDLPVGVHGDVIVEVTIDPDGHVVDTRLIQGIGYGIEQKVLEVLQRWHFHPATKDGVTIASQHIVHFHYPS
jgi:TonB family protein